MMRKLKQNKAITLVALVITIIVLLILAGITINLTVGQNGIMNMAEKAGKNYVDAEASEQEELAKLNNELDSNVGGTRDLVTLTTEEYNKLKNVNTYSQEEVEIGTWIDGKKLYRKVIIGTIGSTTDQVFYHGLTNIDKIFIERAILLDAGGTYHDIPSSKYFNMLYVNTSGIGLGKTAAGNYTGVPVWISINYTKTN